MFYIRYGKMVEQYRATGVRDHSTFSWPQKKGEGGGGEEWIFFIKYICKKLAVFKTDIVYDIILNTIYKFNILQFMTGKHYD